MASSVHMERCAFRITRCVAIAKNLAITMLWFCRSCTQLLRLLQNFLILMSFTKVRVNHTNMEVCYIYSFRLYWTYASSARLSKTISSRFKASHTIIRVPTAMASFTKAPVLWWWILSHFCWTPTIYASLWNGSSRRRVSGFNEQNDWVDWLSIKLEGNSGESF